MSLWTVTFWRAAAERSVRCAAAALVAAWGVGSVVLDVHGIDWRNSLGIAGGAAVGSLVLSVALSNVGPKGSPSTVPDPAAAAAAAPPAL